MDPTDSEKETVSAGAPDSLPPEPRQEAAASLFANVDPIAVGGALGGMTAGEVIGGAIGGVIGAVAGPAGIAIGAGLGAFAGTTIGAKLGYDVTHEIVHPEDADHNATLDERARGVARITVLKAGDAVGAGIGAAGGALVGTVVAGPIGGKVGAFVGEAVAGGLGEGQAANLYTRVERIATHTQGAQIEPDPEAASGSRHPDKKQWLANVARETAGETGLAATLGAMGGLIGGDPGRTLGRRAGTVVAKHLNWAFPFARKDHNPSQVKGVTAETEKPTQP